MQDPLFARMMGAIFLNTNAQELQEALAAKASIEDILDNLSLIYQGETVNLLMPVSGILLEDITNGLVAIAAGYSIEEVRDYFEEGLALVDQLVNHLTRVPLEEATQVEYSFGNIQPDGTIPTPDFVRRWFEELEQQ